MTTIDHTAYKVRNEVLGKRIADLAPFELSTQLDVPLTGKIKIQLPDDLAEGLGVGDHRTHVRLALQFIGIQEPIRRAGY